MIDWVQRRGQIKHLLYELCLTGRIDKATFCEQIADLNNVTPIVRCKDCKHFHKAEPTKGDISNVSYCLNEDDGLINFPNEDDFCSRAVRKDEAEESELEKEFSEKGFAHEMRILSRSNDIEMAHILADALMCNLLRELGYGEGVQIFEDMKKWYS